jgi:Uma2 family endonuclease
MAQPPLTLRRWTRAEYERLVDLGVFEGDPIELVGGQLVVAEPKGPYHTSAVSAAEYALRAVLPPGWIVRTQAPVALDDYRHAHPARPALAVEVADSSLAFDRDHKSSLYARSGFEDYWVVNLVERVLEVYRDPAPDASAPYGWRYRSVTTWAPPAEVVPLAFTSSRIAVGDLFP